MHIVSYMNFNVCYWTTYQMRPKFSEKQLLVSVVAGTKLKDLKVSYGFTKYYGVYVYLKNIFFRLPSETKNFV